MNARVAAVALLLGACGGAPPRVTLAPPTAAPAAADYVDHLKQYSRHGHVIADFDEALTIDATLHAPQFRSAYASKWIDTYRLNAEDAAKKRAQLMAEIADVYEVHAETSTHFYGINDFTQGKGIWRITLIDDQGRAVQPADARQSLDKRDVDLAFYPYAGIFSRGWRFRFPRTLPDGSPLVQPDTKWIALRIAGPQGSTDLIWELKR
jgi:hypothetical protein